MTKIKKFVAAAVAAISMGAIGVTAFAADPTNYYSFSLEGSDDLYYGVSNGVSKHDWQNPAVVKVSYGNLNPTHRAYLAVTGDAFWPEDNILSVEKKVDSITGCQLEYKADYVVTLEVYLLATTGDDYVTLDGRWKP